MSDITQALARTLEATLSPDGNTRIKAELDLRQIYFNRPETAIALVQLVLNQSSPLALRQSATTTLDKFVLATWSAVNKDYSGLEIDGRRIALPEETKAAVRLGVWTGLEDPASRISGGCAKIVSTIAHVDFPDTWPDLPQQLLTLLSSPSPNTVHGALRVLNDFVGAELSEDQLIPLARNMLPRLQEIFQSREKHLPSTRARAVLIFRQCVETLFTVKDNHPNAVQMAIGEILPSWLGSFLSFLETRQPGEEIIVGALFRSLDTIQTCFPKSLVPQLQPLIWASISTLDALYPYYRALYINSSLPQPDLPTTDDDALSSDVACDFANTIANTLDWLCNSTKRKPAKKTLVEGGSPKKELDTLVLLALKFGKMTEEKEEEWANTASAMVADEEDESAKFDVRLASIDLITILNDVYEEETVRALWTAIHQITTESDAQRQAGESDWWKGYESILNTTASIAPDLIDLIGGGGSNFFNINMLFDGIVVPNLSNLEYPYLQGRAFVFASQFSSVLPADVAGKYVEAAINVLEKPDATVPVKISAVRAVKNFSTLLPAEAMSVNSVRIIRDLTPLLAQTSDNVTVLLIETLQSSISPAGKLLDDETTTTVSVGVLQAWGANPQDPILTATVADFFGALGRIPTPIVDHAFVSLILPKLSEALSAGLSNPDAIQTPPALEIISTIVDSKAVPFGGNFFTSWGPIVLKLLLVSQDPDIMMDGLKALTSVVRKDVSQILAWRDENGQTGLDFIFQIVSRSLNGDGGFSQESGGIYVGDLVVHLLRKASAAVIPILPDLLTAFVKRLATATTSTFIQSLVLPFAYLIQAGEVETVLNLLEGVQIITTEGSQKSGLEVLLVMWIENNGYFQGYWNIKVSTIALSKLLITERPSLNTILVKGDRILTAQNANTIMTRSRTRQNPDQYTIIPFPVKCLKLLLHELQNAGDDAVITTKNETVDSEINSDDGDDDWEEEEDLTKVNDLDLQLLSDFMGGQFQDDGLPFDTQEGDEDLKDDPIYNVDVQQHVSQVLKDMNQHCLPEGIEGKIGVTLQEEEKDVLRKALSF